MSPEAAIAAYGDALTDTISVTRYVGAPPSQTSTIATSVRARVLGYQPHEIQGTVLQGDMKVVVLKSDLDKQAWPVPMKKGDKITVDGGTTLTVEAVDKQTRKVGGTLVAYECQARGS